MITPAPESQFRRNHSIRYAATPDQEWDARRREHPRVLESYADIAPREWLHLRLDLDGRRLRAFVSGARQPSLVVNDLKLGVRVGTVAL